MEEFGDLYGAFEIAAEEGPNHLLNVVWKKIGQIQLQK